MMHDDDAVIVHNNIHGGDKTACNDDHHELLTMTAG